MVKQRARHTRAKPPNEICREVGKSRFGDKFVYSIDNFKDSIDNLLDLIDNPAYSIDNFPYSIDNSSDLLAPIIKPAPARVRSGLHYFNSLNFMLNS